MLHQMLCIDSSAWASRLFGKTGLMTQPVHIDDRPRCRDHNCPPCHRAPLTERRKAQCPDSKHYAREHQQIPRAGRAPVAHAEPNHPLIVMLAVRLPKSFAASEAAQQRHRRVGDERREHQRREPDGPYALQASPNTLVRPRGSPAESPPSRREKSATDGN
jgi:hypothetical protein